MRLIFVLLLGFILLSATSDKVPRKFRGLYLGSLSSFSLGSGDEAIDVSGATIKIELTKTLATIEIEGKTFDSPLVLKSVTKAHSTYNLDLPVPLKNSSLRIEKKGKKMEWQCPGFEDVILVK